MKEGEIEKEQELGHEGEEGEDPEKREEQQEQVKANQKTKEVAQK